jgi:cell division protease FtsH
VFVVAMGLATLFGPEAPEELDYTEFVALVEAGEVENVTIDEDGRASGELVDETPFQTVVPTALPQEELTETLLENDVEIEGDPPAPEWWGALIWLIPLLLIGGLIWMGFRRAQGQMSQLQGVGKSQADVIDTERPDTTFDDVAGYDEVRHEVTEVIDYLRDPERFHRVGARGPGGILMVGPAGTGKTLMARALAGEADVPFISASGSEFVEMLVGVGAARIRDLFSKARERQPAIVFIDELDSVGRKRGSQASIGSNNEQEQTLNQLLKELDGFDSRQGVVIIAATNRPEMLDDALLRPGRFDRQVEIPLPKQSDRVEILRVHARGKPVADDVDLELVARGTPGFSGAQLENLMNEAAITAVRAERTEIRQEDLDEARERILLGKRQSSEVLRESERRRVAVHESGHALVAALAEDADPVAKVSILPTQQALGTTEQLPLEERRLASEGELHDSLAVRFGGRVAEALVFEDLSTGAANDLAGATELATRMVREFGFSEKFGPASYPSQDDGSGLAGLQAKPYAEETQKQLDEEVARLLREAEERAEQLIAGHRDAFDQLVERLLEEEVLDGEAVYALVGRPPRDDED